MEEILCTIKVYKDNNIFIGKMFSDIDGEKNFENERIECLLRDIINDIQLNLDESNNEFGNYSVTE